MNAHTRKTYESILSGKAPRDLEWGKFVTLWEDIADKVENESGDRLSVTMNGHRVVFRRPHDGIVSLEDIENARHLIKATPDLKGSGHVVAVVIDERSARIFDFDLDAVKVEDTEHTVDNPVSQDRHLRKVERETGNDEEHTLVTFYDDVARELTQVQRFVVLGHGVGTSNAAVGFVDRLHEKHGELAGRVVGVGDIDLSAANDAAIEDAAVKLSQGA